MEKRASLRKLVRTVPSAVIDCVTKLQLLTPVARRAAQKVMKNGNNANTQTVNRGQSLRLAAVLDDLGFPAEVKVIGSSD